MKIPKTLHPGFELAKQITKTHAKTFYTASFLLDEPERWASYSIYAVCRFSDDSVDNSKQPYDQLQIISQKIKSAFENQAANDPILTAFQMTINKYHIPQSYFEELLSGMEMDLTKTRYENFNELYTYCYKVAGVIGLIMLKLFGTSDSKANEHAVELGIAMQLTNILRDIKEDYSRGRIYLPKQEIVQFKITEEMIAQDIVSSEFKEFMRFQINRCRRYYKESLQGLNYITSRKGKFTAFVMADLYGAILEKIEQQNYDVFKKRVFLSLKEKLLRIFFLKIKSFSFR